MAMASDSLSNHESLKKNLKPDTKLCDFCVSEIPIKASICRFCKNPIGSKSTEEGTGWLVEREELNKNESGFVTKVTQVWLLVQDEKVKQNLRQCLHNDNRMLEKVPRLPLDDLFTVLPAIRNQLSQWERNGSVGLHPLAPLLDFLETEYKEKLKMFAQMQSERVVSFEMLQALFPRGSKFVGRILGQLVGTEVHDTAYIRSAMGIFFQVTGEFVKSNGDHYYNQRHQFIVPMFRGLRKIDEMEVQPMSDEAYAKLQARGRQYERLALGSHYLRYTGTIYFQTPHFVQQFKADGRVMADTVSFNKMNPNYQHFTEVNNNVIFMNGGNRSTTGAVQTIPEESYYRTWPTVGGFSFSMKKWGEVVIDRCSDVVFDDHAFERLVLPAEKKRLIKALIMHTSHSVADIITGKGGGCIFALHGPPGTGKTVTAESIAELLHRPLYSISVGELGTTTESLERGLRDILEVASAWNAVILIDEADVFLEQRRDSDIQRNAMVGVFLRLLEYHQGVLFLTTNRVHTFDEAFHSRISVALHYPELDAAARRKIWVNFIDASGVKSFSAAQLDSLAQHRLNGRQIRNVVRLAQALARDDNLECMTMRHLEETIGITLQFLPASTDIGAANTTTSGRKLNSSSNGVVFSSPAASQY